MRAMPLRVRLSFLAIAFAVAGCASAPPKQSTAGNPQAAGRAAGHALKMVGKPYRYGGASPSRGFDCSGLVQYSYAHAGVKLPRSTEAQLRLARPIPRSQLRRGDLIFFDEQGGDNS